MIKTTITTAAGVLLLLSGCAKVNAPNQSKEVATVTKTYNQGEAISKKVVSAVDRYEENYNKTMEAFTKTLKNKEETKNLSDANKTINTMLELIACAPKNIEQNNAYKNQLYPYVTKNSASKNIHFPIASSKKRADEGECFSIEQMNQYKKLTNNVFTFNTLYISPTTGAKSNVEYRMVKDSKTKEWLFRF